MLRERANAEGTEGDGRLYTTGDMARLSHNTVRTVRFYEETGVLQPASRSDGGHRLFPPTELDKLLFVTDMRSTGLSLEEIRVLLSLKASAPSGREAASQVASAIDEHVRILDTKIAELTRLREELTHAAAHLQGCAVCEHDAHFPADCSACEKMQHQGPLPRTVRVLWNVSGGEKVP